MDCLELGGALNFLSFWEQKGAVGEECYKLLSIQLRSGTLTCIVSLEIVYSAYQYKDRMGILLTASIRAKKMLRNNFLSISCIRQILEKKKRLETG